MNDLVPGSSNDLRVLLAERLEQSDEFIEAVPLSFSQRRLWFIDQVDPGSARYNMPSVTRWKVQLDVPALERAIESIVQRHEPLRTRFVSHDGEPTQVIDDPPQVRIAIHDLSFVPQAERERELQIRLLQEVIRPFDLSAGHLIRATLFRMEREEREYVLMINIHHIVCDEWSFQIFYRELAAFYSAFSRGETLSLPPLAIQFSDYALWQGEWLQSPAFDLQLNYWKEQLRGRPSAIELATDRPRRSDSPGAGAARWHGLGLEITAGLKRMAHDERVSTFMLLLAVFKLLLFRYTRQSDVIVGCPIAGRNSVETEDLIGFFVNTLALRTQVSGEITFLELLRRVRDVSLAALSHQEIPFDKIVEALQPERGINTTPFVNVMFFDQQAPSGTADSAGLNLEFLDPGSAQAKFDLTLAVHEDAGELIAVAHYNSDLFDSTTIARFLHHFDLLVQAIVAKPGCCLEDLPLLTEVERRQLLIDWNATRSDYPRRSCIHELFDQQVRRTPNAMAVIFGECSLTYLQLYERANQIAHHLQRSGVRPGDVVAFVGERSMELIAGLLGIVKAGAAYAALDPELPAQRLAALLDELRPRVLLFTSGLLLDRLAEISSAQPLFLGPSISLDSKSLQEETGEPPPVNITAEHLAYISFTSGSTGLPKGVCVPHRAVVRLVRETSYAKFSSNAVFLQMAPVAFDASTFEIWGPLLNGGRLVVMPPGKPALSELKKIIERHHVTTAWFTSGLFNQIIDELPEAVMGLEQILTGGDVVSPSHVKKAQTLLPSTRIINGYGPTENTTFTTCYTLPPGFDGEGTVPIGRPISNSCCYVLDSNLQPVPVGIPGELFCGGDGLATGYLNAPALTAERFVPNPFEPGRLLYRTGDLARYLPDANLEFLGRIDGQVKVRGFRVEPGEIEWSLLQHPQVQQCAVLARNDPTAGKQLVAYLVPREAPGPTPDELESFLRQRLPEYMIPNFFVSISELPLTANGKLDRAALPEPEQAVSGGTAPRDEIEKRLVEIWESVLSVKPVGIHDRFFALGGHSLLAVRLAARIEKSFGQTVSVAAIFQNPTVARLASFLRKTEPTTPTSSIVEIQPHGRGRPLFLVHGVGGGMFWGYGNLARHLGTGQPVFGFKSRGLEGLEEFDSIETMAASYLGDLRNVQSRGPYYLGGYCFGGVVAYEMARQLQDQDEEIALLLQINSNPPNSSYTTFSWTPDLTWRFLKNFYRKTLLSFQLPTNFRREFFRRNTSVALNRIQRIFCCSPAPERSFDELADPTHYSEIQRKVWAAHVRALQAYHPRPYRGRLTLLRSRVHHLFCSFDQTFGWAELALGGVDVRILKGAHEALMDEPNVGQVAKELASVLNSARQYDCLSTPTGWSAASAP